MRWYSSLLIVAFLWANAALGNAGPVEWQPTSLIPNYTSPSASLFARHHFSKKIEDGSTYKQVKYSKKLSRYSWLKDKKPKVFSDYSKLNRITFSHNLPPVNFIIKEIFHVSSIDYDNKGNLRLHVLQAWMQNPPDCANRLSGWKESNILYKGSLTYHSVPTTI